ncbi:HprK-related kinase A [Paraglaciecola aquimarina]|uniref:HprK-related kinase A n=1 Tax=Paraglaciecola aquimarina TaxID=1235557 RepID=A0ABU3T2A2_9ALTE|nr:HprK-related kinase A [Paraglaciecola aquimarina]MDU0356337.1 HprK-related kinase A [Paraglaciecola aquimarina]
MTASYFLDLHPFSFSIQTDITQVISNLSTIYGDRFKKLTSEVADYELSVQKSAGLRSFLRPQARFFCDQLEPFKPLSLQKSFAFLEWGMNWTVAANEVQHVIIHSAVLAKGNKAILFPAPPGSGKSTLTAYLSHNGWRLLSDEMALIIPNTKTVIPFVRPICLKNQSIEIAKRLFPNGKFSNIAKDTHKGDVIHLSPPELSWQNQTKTAELVGIVFPNYRANQDLQIYQLDKTQGFMQLVNNAFNYSILRETAFSTLTQVVEGVQTFEIFHNDLAEVAEFLEQEIIEHG